MKILLISLIIFGLTSTPSYGKEKTITLAEGMVVEATYMKIENNEALGDYYKQLIPLIAEYGGKPMIDFSVESVDHGKIHPNFIVFLMFPSSDDRTRLLNDNRFIRLFHLFDDATSGFYIEHSSVKNETTFTFSDTKVYEVYTLWINSQKAQHLNTYFNEVSPMLGELDVKFPVGLKPISTSSSNNMPSASGIVEWPDHETKELFLASQVFKLNVHNRTKALRKMNVFTTKAVIY